MEDKLFYQKVYKLAQDVRKAYQEGNISQECYNRLGRIRCPECGNTWEDGVSFVTGCSVCGWQPEIKQERTVEWEARWSGGQKECAVLVDEGKVIPQSEFARHLCHVNGGSEKYKATVQSGRVLFLYRSGSGKTETVTDLESKEVWYSFYEAECNFDLPEGALWQAFIN